MTSSWLHGTIFLLTISFVFAVIKTGYLTCLGEPAVHVDYMAMPISPASPSLYDRNNVMYQSTSDHEGKFQYEDDDFNEGNLVFYHTCGLPDVIAERCLMRKKSWQQNLENSDFDLGFIEKDKDFILCGDQQNSEMPA